MFAGGFGWWDWLMFCGGEREVLIGRDGLMEGVGGIDRNAVSRASAIAPPRTRASSVCVWLRIELVLTSDGLDEQELADVCGGIGRDV
jgi:hypothetical protein